MPENTTLPRVLIYGETFRKIGGGGITLNTLFEAWPVENIFMLVERSGQPLDVHFIQYYQVGHLENKSFIHKLGILTGNKSGAFRINKNKLEKTITIQSTTLFKSNFYFKLKDLFISILNWLGIYGLFFRQNVSKELIQWINEIKPDIIYFQPSTIQNIKFLTEIHNLTGIPYAIHVMDNILETHTHAKEISGKNILSVQLFFEELIRKSNLCLGICDEMSTQYGIKFNRLFYSFQHAVDNKFWFRNYMVRRDPQPFVILYAGRISLGTSQSLFLLAKAIDNCNRNYECNFEFQIQGTSPDIKWVKRFSKYKCVKIHDVVPYNSLPERYTEADLLVLPMDFDKKSLTYIKYSMPTKVPEYLVSGVPIFVLAHEITALYKYAKSENWAFINSTEKVKDVEKLLMEIRNNYNKRVEVSEIAKSVGKRNHDIHIVRDSFKQLISKSCHTVL